MILLADSFLLQPGLYVLGLINKSAASRAGFEQGDQILEVDGTPIREQSPFQTAALIQGPDDAPATPAVTLKASPMYAHASHLHSADKTIYYILPMDLPGGTANARI